MIINLYPQNWHKNFFVWFLFYCFFQFISDFSPGDNINHGRPIILFYLMENSVFSPLKQVTLAQVFKDGYVERDEHFFLPEAKKISFYISPKKLDRIIHKALDVGFFDKNLTMRAVLGVDIDFHGIEIVYQGQTYKMENCQTVFEQRNKNECSKDFQRFRKIWSSMLTILDQELVPERKQEKYSGASSKSPTVKRKLGRDVQYDHYVDNCDGTITDINTGLMWTKTDSRASTGEGKNWYEAKAWVESLTTGGHTDWRLPTIVELATIYEPSYNITSCYRNAKVPLHMCPLFASEGAFFFWSSEEGDIPGGSRMINFGSGRIGLEIRVSQSNDYGVRGVRSSNH